MKKSFLALAVCIIALPGCYHATVNTGAAPGPAPKVNTWAHSWIAGLVPPKAINAQEKCNGKNAAVVETQMSPANWIVGVLTGGIYTPMTISVTCAQAPQP